MKTPRPDPKPLRAPLSPDECAQLNRLAANVGPTIAARSVGVKRDTFKSARAGNQINQVTRDRIRASGWLTTSEGRPES